MIGSVSVIIEVPQGPQIDKNVNFEFQLRRISLFGSYSIDLRLTIRPALKVPACGQPTGETAGQYFCCVVSNNSIIDVVVVCTLLLIDLWTTLRWGHK